MDKNNEIVKIVNRVVKINEINKNNYRNGIIPNDLILFSLGAAMKSFFSLHTSYINRNIYQRDYFKEVYDYEISFVYIDLYHRGIIHFQHFFELIIKEIIRNKDENLILVKNRKTIGFDRAFEVLEEQNKKGNITGDNITILINAKKELAELNNLRNKILHRGQSVLRFHEYITFIIKYILPIIQPALNALNLVDKEKYWKYKNVLIKDPIDELILSMKSKKYDYYTFIHILLLMKIGDAAYKNPLPIKPEESNYKDNFYKVALKRYESKLEQYESIAGEIYKYKYEMSDGNKNIWLKKCLVCGLNTLIIKIETDFDYNEKREQSLIITEVLAHCECCSFEIDNAILEPVNFGYNVDKLFIID